MKKNYLWILLLIAALIILVFIGINNPSIFVNNTDDGNGNSNSNTNSVISSTEKSIELKYSTGYPGFGYYDLYIINNSGKYVWIDANEYWMNKLGYPQIRFLEPISYADLLSISQQIENKGFFSLNDNYIPAEPTAGGTGTWISVKINNQYKKVMAYANIPSPYIEIENILKSYYPEKKDCSLKNPEDFPTLDISSKTVCSTYYTRYFDYCTCI